MIINGEVLPTIAVFPSMVTMPDCAVVNSNKIGSGNGEAKIYMSSKNEMRAFYGKEKFSAKCFVLKSDLLSYMTAIKSEYMTPSQNYRKREEMPTLWDKRVKEIQKMGDIIFFTVHDQYQIDGPRGYINSEDQGYKLIREIALPLVSYIYIEKVGKENAPLFYWKLFVDFDAIWERKNGPLVFNYGKQKNAGEPADNKDKKEEKKRQEIRVARDGQGKYREQLLEQCHFCPITMISDERLLIASHIKPWVVSTDEEKVDPYNGYMLSPLYDKLFDRGFITFTSNRHMILSDFISQYTWKLMNLKNNTFIKALPMDDKRVEYLKFHHESVFKGSYSEKELEADKKSSKYEPYHEKVYKVASPTYPDRR